MKNFDLIETRDSYHVDNEIIFLGEIERNNDFECKKFPSVLENGNEDTAIDDTGIAIDTPKGIVVISGCGHSGICNTIEQAKRLLGKNYVYCVIGGFHLKECDDQTYKTIEYMKDNNIERLILGHCTSDVVCEEFIKNELKIEYPHYCIEDKNTANKNTGIAEPKITTNDVQISKLLPFKTAFFMPKGIAMR